MAKTKAKTVTVRVAVIYDANGQYQAGGYATTRRRSVDYNLIVDARQSAPSTIENLPHACIVEIELPIPEPAEPLVGKVLSVKAVKP